MKNCPDSDASGSSRGNSVAAMTGLRLQPAGWLGLAAWMTFASAALANAAVPAQRETSMPPADAQANHLPNGQRLSEAKNIRAPLVTFHRLQDGDATAQQRTPDVFKLAQSQQMCWHETASGGGGNIGWRPCNYPTPSPEPPSAKSSGGSSTSYRQPSRTNNAATAAAAAGAVGALLQLLGDINSGTKGSQADYDEAQREIDRLSAEELRRYNEQLRQAEESNKRLQEGASGQGDGSGNPFASTAPNGSVEDNPFAASAQSTASAAAAPPNGANPFAKTAAKPKDPTQNYAGRSCAYFTAAPDDTHLNTYADGANVCYGDKMYVCEGRSWRYLGPCSAFAGGNSRQADKLEKTRFNTKIYEDE